MMMTEMDIETSVYYVHLTRLIAQEDFIKFTRRESTKTYIISGASVFTVKMDLSLIQALKERLMPYKLIVLTAHV
jgi:hypothetical protein